MRIHTSASFRVSGLINTVVNRRDAESSQDHAMSVSCGWEDSEEAASVSPRWAIPIFET
jgi:hypothetical protein